MESYLKTQTNRVSPRQPAPFNDAGLAQIEIQFLIRREILPYTRIDGAMLRETQRVKRQSRFEVRSLLWILAFRSPQRRLRFQKIIAFCLEIAALFRNTSKACHETLRVYRQYEYSEARYGWIVGSLCERQRSHLSTHLHGAQTPAESRGDHKTSLPTRNSANYDEGRVDRGSLETFHHVRCKSRLAHAA